MFHFSAGPRKANTLYFLQTQNHTGKEEGASTDGADLVLTTLKNPNIHNPKHVRQVSLVSVSWSSDRHKAPGKVIKPSEEDE